MYITGLQKTTLLDYPGKLAATVFLGGCNLRCPFCHNQSVAINPLSLPAISEDTILSFLKKRSGVLDGVCITGGEPTLNPDLPEFLKKIRETGLLIKLDTNGTRPDMLRTLFANQLVDCVAMDIKNSPEHYAKTAGTTVSLEDIEESIDLIVSSGLSYEFRTTVVRQLHTVDDFKKIGQWLKGPHAYYLQAFVDSGNLICPNTFTSYSKEELQAFVDLLKVDLPNTSLRGI